MTLSTRLFPCLAIVLLLFSGACTGVDEAKLVAGAPPVPPTVNTSTTPVDTQASEPEQETPSFDPATAPLDAELPVDSKVRVGTLDNGLKYFIRVNAKPEQRAELRIALNAGSVLEDDDQLGMAHFVEHMAFNGTENFEKHELVDYLQSIGMRFGADINASTGFDQTIYKLTVPTDDAETLDRAMLVLSDQAGRVSFDPEEIDKERGVVLEEWRRSRGAYMRLANKQLPVMLQGSKYAERLPIGTAESIQNTPHANIKRFFETWYRPDLMAVAAVGDFDPDVVEGLIREHFGSLKGPDNPPPRPEVEVPRVAATRFSIETDPEVTSTSLSVMFNQEAGEQGRVQDYRRSIVENLHISMFNARLQELAQAVDSPFVGVGSGTGSIVRPVAAYQLSSTVREGQTAAALESILRELERLRRFGFTDGELERAKLQVQRLFEQVYKERDKQRSSGFASEFVRSFLTGESIPGIETEVALVQRFLPGITLDEVNALTEEWVTDDNRIVVISGPEKENLELPEPDTILALFEQAAKEEISPWVDRTRDEPLLAEIPVPGRVVEEKFHETTGITEWRLENGVRVLLKPTDFKNDEILMSSISPGGTSLVENEQYTSASFATFFLGQSGLGDFDLVELKKALTGKVADASPFIGELNEGLSGSASPEDLETLFQLTYLYFTSPRADEEIYRNLMSRMTAVIENRSKNPETVFRDEFQKRVSGDHFRRRPLTTEVLAEFDPEAALDAYRDRFADASDFTFTFVGNFETSTLKPWVETYLGGLPASNRGESWRDIGIRHPEGQVRFEVEKGLEPKSLVDLLFHGEAEWSRQNRFDLLTLSRVLEIQMTELVREEMGATYSVGVYGSLSRWPEERFNLTVRYSCNPDEVDRILEPIFAKLKEVQEKGPEAEMVEKVRENLKRNREVQLKENTFWLNAIEGAVEHDLPFDDILEFDQLLATLSTESIQKAANQYLSFDQYVLGILKPEKTSTGADEAPTPTGSAN